MAKLHFAPFPESAPPCRDCSGPTARQVANLTNTNGNAGRPYYRCDPCRKFVVFADRLGNLSGNPPCTGCGVSSKSQVSSPYARVSGMVFYVCRLGRCDFYEEAVRADGSLIRVRSVEEFRLWRSMEII